MGAHDRGVEHLNQMGGAAQACERIQGGLEHPGLAQAPEALPDRVPVPECGRQSAPGDVVDCEIVQRLEEPAVIPALSAPPRAAGAEHLKHRRPILICHPARMVGSSQTDPPGVTDPPTWESPQTNRPNPSKRPRVVFRLSLHHKERDNLVTGPPFHSSLRLPIRAEMSPRNDSLTMIGTGFLGSHTRHLPT
jgi:hypothetical protein